MKKNTSLIIETDFESLATRIEDGLDKIIRYAQNLDKQRPKGDKALSLNNCNMVLRVLEQQRELLNYDETKLVHKDKHTWIRRLQQTLKPN